MNTIVRFSQFVGEGINKLVALLMVLLIVDVSWQVITRFLLAQPSSFTEEIARFLLIWISLLGAAVAYRYADHLGFDLLTKKVNDKKQIAIARFNILVAVFFGVVVLGIGGGNVVYIVYTMEQYSSVLGINMAYVYSVVPITGVLFVLFSIERLFNQVAASQEDVVQNTDKEGN